MDSIMEKWSNVVFEWIEATNIIPTVADIKQINKAEFFTQLLTQLSITDESVKVDTENIFESISSFIKDSYPDFKFHHDPSNINEFVRMCSLIIYHCAINKVTRCLREDPCERIKIPTQHKIKNFVEYLLKNHSKIDNGMIDVAIRNHEPQMPTKKYGLIKPGTSKPSLKRVQKPSIHSAFGDSSDSDEQVPQTKQKFDTPAHLQQKNLKEQQKLVEEDPTIYQYDEIYDDMQSEKKELLIKTKKVDDRKPKYIANLLKTAERRKRDYELRIARQVEKERAEEGEQFRDKEVFVTAAYKKKLEELKQLEAAEEREAYLEAIGDVTRQADLSGIYRHLYEVNVKNEDKNEIDASEKKRKFEEEQKNEQKGSEESTEPKDSKKKNKKIKKRTYRQRKIDGENDDDEKFETLPENIDADSDFSIDSDSSDDSQSKEKNDDEVVDSNKNDQKEKSEDIEKEKEKIPSKNDDKPLEFERGSPVNDKNDDVPEIVEIKVDIWKKRTVGAVFDDALMRYYQRKASREAGV